MPTIVPSFLLIPLTLKLFICIQGAIRLQRTEPGQTHTKHYLEESL